MAIDTRAIWKKGFFRVKGSLISEKGFIKGCLIKGCLRGKASCHLKMVNSIKETLKTDNMTEKENFYGQMEKNTLDNIKMAKNTGKGHCYGATATKSSVNGNKAC